MLGQSSPLKVPAYKVTGTNKPMSPGIKLPGAPMKTTSGTSRWAVSMPKGAGNK